MSVITEITPVRYQYNLVWDNGQRLTIRKKDMAKLGLTAGIDIEYEELVDRLCPIQSADAYESALTLLDSCARTESEMRKKLRLRHYVEPVIDYVVDRLTNANLLNDTELAHRIAVNASAGGKGKYAIVRKLRSKGIATDDIEDAMEEVTDEDQKKNCLRECRRLSTKYDPTDKRAYKSKLSQALMRRGFSWDSIEYAMNRVLDGDDDD